MHILTISLGRNILKTGSREQLRMHSYARHADSLHIVVLTRHEHGYTEAIHEGNLHIYPTNSRSRFFMLVDAYQLGRTIIGAQRDVPFTVSGQDPLEIGWLSFFLARIMHVDFHIQVHGDYFSSDAWVGHSFLRRMRRLLARILLKRAPRIRVVSRRIFDSLLVMGISSERITVLPIRPELEVFLQTIRPTRVVPPFTFLYLGRLAPEKDVMRIVLAFTELRKSYPDIRLKIVGDGEERKKIDSVIHKHHLEESVSLAPWTTQVAEEMASADVFLLASKHEAYALTLIESLAVGTPLVTTDVGCVGEVVEDNVHGIVVRESGVVPYSKAMEKMITDLEFLRLCGERGRELGRALAIQTEDAYAGAWVTSVCGNERTGIMK